MQHVIAAIKTHAPQLAAAIRPQLSAFDSETILAMATSDDLAAWERLDDVIMGGSSSSALEAAPDGGGALWKGDLVMEVRCAWRAAHGQPRVRWVCVYVLCTYTQARRCGCHHRRAPPSPSHTLNRHPQPPPPKTRLESTHRARTQGGGFCGARTKPLNLDLSAYDGLQMRVKGDGQIFKFNIKTVSVLGRSGARAAAVCGASCTCPQCLLAACALPERARACAHTSSSMCNTCWTRVQHLFKTCPS
jgi:hypothetical protein